MKKSSFKIDKVPLLATVTGLSHEGRGIAIVKGKTTFIRGALPDEDVSFYYTRKKGSYDEGELLEVLRPSATRIMPICAHATICGGCSLQHMSAEQQITLKQNTVMDLLKHTAHLEPLTWLPPLVGPTSGHRRSARLGVRYVIKKERVLVGFREINSHYLADILRCETLDARIGTHLTALAACIQSLTLREHIAQVEIACGDEAVALVIRHLMPLPAEDQEKLMAFAKQYAFHLYLQNGGPDTVIKIFPRDAIERLHHHLPLFHLTFAFHPLDFIQINAVMNQQMVAKALDLLDIQPNETVLDLFCGLGNFSLPLATKARRVLAIEGSAAMVKRGEENARLNHLNNIQFEVADLFKPTQPFASQSFDKILLDPPRSGAIDIIPLIASLHPKAIVYVSCNPATFARDAGELVKYGYTFDTCGVMDMFPHTNHIETIALFQRV